MLCLSPTSVAFQGASPCDTIDFFEISFPTKRSATQKSPCRTGHSLDEMQFVNFITAFVRGLGSAFGIVNKEWTDVRVVVRVWGMGTWKVVESWFFWGGRSKMEKH